jgi:hypothetical protein
MSYEQIDRLTNNITFQGRVRACCTQEAESFRSDGRPDIAALATEVLRTGGPVFNFVRIIAASPGAAPVPAKGDELDQSVVTDALILGQVQAQWPVVASLFWDDEGNRINEGGGST